MEREMALAVDRSQLKDIHEFVIDTRKSGHDRIEDFISQIGIP